MWSIRDIKAFLRENPRAKLEDFAKLYGVSKQAVACRLKRMNITWRELKNEAIKNQLERYVKEHLKLTRQQIEHDFGLSYEAVRIEAEKHGIKIKLYREYKASKKEIEDYINKNPKATIKELSEHFGLSFSNMCKRLQKYGLETDRSKKMDKNEIAKKLQEEKIRKYIIDHRGITMSGLAKAFNVTYATMKKYLEIYDIKLPATREIKNITIKKEEIERFLNENPRALLKDLSEHFGITVYLIKKHLYFYRIRLSGRNAQITKEDLQEYIEKNPKAKKTAIARYFNVSRSTINKYIEKYGLQIPINESMKKDKGYVESELNAGNSQNIKDLTREELLMRIIQILKSVNGVSVQGLKIFLQSKGIDISEEDILEYQKRLMEENRKKGEGR